MIPSNKSAQQNPGVQTPGTTPRKVSRIPEFRRRVNEIEALRALGAAAPVVTGVPALTVAKRMFHLYIRGNEMHLRGDR
jgi:hypothetical protein